MKKKYKLIAALWPLLAMGLAGIADEPASTTTVPSLPVVPSMQVVSPMPVVSVQTVTTDDPSGYATLIAGLNEKYKAATGIARFNRVYLGVYAGDSTGVVFTIRAADSVATLTRNVDALMALPDMPRVKGDLARIRKLGPAKLLKAVHYEGSYDGAWLINFDLSVKDEPAFLKAIDGLRALYDAHGLKDCRISIYKVIAGRSDFTHMAVIATPSEARMAVYMDTLTEPWEADWLAAAARVRSVVRNGIYKEITP